MRELKRSIAREKMKKAGFQHINRKKFQGEDKKPRSIFSIKWREWVLK